MVGLVFSDHVESFYRVSEKVFFEIALGYRSDKFYSSVSYTDVLYGFGSGLKRKRSIVLKGEQLTVFNP